MRALTLIYNIICGHGYGLRALDHTHTRNPVSTTITSDFFAGEEGVIWISPLGVQSAASKTSNLHLHRSYPPVSRWFNNLLSSAISRPVLLTELTPVSGALKSVLAAVCLCSALDKEKKRKRRLGALWCHAATWSV